MLLMQTPCHPSHHSEDASQEARPQVHGPVEDVVPADCRILDSTEFSVDNSTITGESEPVELDATATHEKQLFSKNMAFNSACVVRGQAKAVVTRTVSIQKETCIRVVVSEGQWVQLCPSILRIVQLRPSIFQRI